MSLGSHSSGTEKSTWRMKQWWIVLWTDKNCRTIDYDYVIMRPFAFFLLTAGLLNATNMTEDHSWFRQKFGPPAKPNCWESMVIRMPKLIERRSSFLWLFQLCGLIISLSNRSTQKLRMIMLGRKKHANFFFGRLRALICHKLNNRRTGSVRGSYSSRLKSWK